MRTAGSPGVGAVAAYASAVAGAGRACAGEGVREATAAVAAAAAEVLRKLRRDCVTGGISGRRGKDCPIYGVAGRSVRCRRCGQVPRAGSSDAGATRKRADIADEHGLVAVGIFTVTTTISPYQ